MFRGRERFNDRFEPGTASITFANDAGWADLVGTYIERRRRRRCDRAARSASASIGPWTEGAAPFTRWLYRGFIDQATPTYDPVLHDVVTVNCIDALGEAGSSTAPQPVTIRASTRPSAPALNRVLDAVGWWATKRKIAATGDDGARHLARRAGDRPSCGQAADSAGGVVFGDLDGDVVFKDIDWMLYDPDDPPDGTIGNVDPGTPPTPGDAAIHRPDPGPRLRPDDPPAEHRPKVCVCADGTAGTLVEKGDNYRLYVRDGHLFYESSGTPGTSAPTRAAAPVSTADPTDGDPPER